MTLWVSSDHHFGHAKIIEFCERPYASLDMMNADLIQRWNAVVQPGDTVWYLGDFCWRNYEHVFQQLHGEKHLVIGNHDHKKTRALPWASKEKYKEIWHIEDGIKTRVVLMHYPIANWNCMYHGSLHLHGHTHGTLPKLPNRWDVGADCWDFRPVTVAEIKASVAAA